MNKKIVALFLFLATIVGIYFMSYSHFKTKTITSESKIIMVDDGDTLNDIAIKLGISGILFKSYVRNDLNPEFVLNGGKYEIEAGANIEKVFENLENPIFDEVNLKILEGWNIYDIDMCLSNPVGMLEESGVICLYEMINEKKEIFEKGLIETGEFIKYATNKEKIIALTKYFPFIEGLNTLEGFLYPDSYKIDGSNFGINKMVIKQLETFEVKVVNKIGNTYSATKWEEIVNLASIVEKEEKNSDAKPTVAGILKKRLNEGWMIGADITVCYPHELTSQECKLVVSKYIKEKSEYNTRTMAGLPKTPIGNPTYETIEATVKSKTTPYYFYLHDTKGSIYYATTNAEHEYNKSRYMR